MIRAICICILLFKLLTPCPVEAGLLFGPAVKIRTTNHYYYGRTPVVMGYYEPAPIVTAPAVVDPAPIVTYSAPVVTYSAPMVSVRSYGVSVSPKPRPKKAARYRAKAAKYDAKATYYGG